MTFRCLTVHTEAADYYLGTCHCSISCWAIGARDAIRVSVPESMRLIPLNQINGRGPQWTRGAFVSLSYLTALGTYVPVPAVILNDFGNVDEFRKNRSSDTENTVSYSYRPKGVNPSRRLIKRVSYVHRCYWESRCCVEVLLSIS